SLEDLNQYKGNNPKIIKIESLNKFDYIFIRIVENVSSVTSRGSVYNKIAYEIEKIFLKRKNNPFVLYFFNPKNARNNIIVITIAFSAIYAYKSYYLKETVNIKQGTLFLVLWLLVLL